jgi:hypothetical protein
MPPWFAAGMSSNRWRAAPQGRGCPSNPKIAQGPNLNFCLSPWAESHHGLESLMLNGARRGPTLTCLAAGSKSGEV